MGATQSTQAAITSGSTETKQHTSFASTAMSAYENNNNNSIIINEDETEEEEEEEEKDNEVEEWWNERLAILEDAKKLRKVAEYFLHPENPVEVDSTGYARCYFAPNLEEVTSTDDEDEEERINIMNDMKLLKKYAQDYLEPHRPVEVHPLSYCRNYFTRYGDDAIQQETFEEAEERNRILSDAMQLKKLAVDYLHPELPCITSDPYATGRNIFTTSSLMSQQESVENMKEREQILVDAQELKKYAMHYMHPELPCVTTDPYATGRNYFTTPSAVEQESLEVVQERVQIIADMKVMKTFATAYLEPHRPVQIDPLATCRNYFDRPSTTYHDELVHTYCEYVENTGFHHIIDHDHHYYWYSNNSNDHHHQFEMEHDDDYDDCYYEFKESTYEVEPFKSHETPTHSPYCGAHSKINTDNLLSSSPSSILLLTW